MDSQMPLRYKISSWRQLPQCLSNNSRDLHIHVSDFYSEILRGFRIRLEHLKFGVLFACVINAKGSIVTVEDDKVVEGLTSEQILQELKKFGFLIEYDPRKHLPAAQLEYLSTLKNLGYDKLRIIGIQNANSYGDIRDTFRVVAFKIQDLPQWLFSGFSPSEKQFYDAVVKGYAINLTDVSKTRDFRWDWLDYVANIDDILRDNCNDPIG